MTRTVGALSMVLLLAAATMVGCKQVETTFVNTSSEPLDLKVQGPGENLGRLGAVPPNGEVRTKIEVCGIWLPHTYTWSAGAHTGTFTVTSDSKAKIWVYVPGPGPQDDPEYRHAEGPKQTGDPSRVTYNP